MSGPAQDFSDLGFQASTPAPQNPTDFSDLGFEAAAPQAKAPAPAPDSNFPDLSKVAGAQPGMGRPASARQIAQGTASRMRPESVSETLETPGERREGTPTERLNQPTDDELARTLASPEYAKQFRAAQDKSGANYAFDPLAGAGDVARGVRDISAAAPAFGSLPQYGVFPTKEQKEAPVNMPQAVHGAAEAAGGAMEAGMGSFGEALARKPIQSALGLAVTYLSGDAGAWTAKEAGATPQEQEDARTLAMFLPGAVTTLAGVRSSEVTGPNGMRGKGVTAFGGRVGIGGVASDEAVGVGAKVGPFSAQVVKPRGEGVQFATGAPKALPEDPAVAVAREQAGAAAQAIQQADALDAAAKNVVQGKPPVPEPPKPPMPEGMEQGQLKPETVQRVAQAISMAPPDTRGQLLMEAHSNLAKWIAQQGRVMGPDGKIVIAKTPEQAAQIAAKWVNDEVARQDAARNQAQKAKGNVQDRITKAENQILKSSKPMELGRLQGEATREGLSDEQYADKLEQHLKSGGKTETAPQPPTQQQRAQTIIEANDKEKPEAVAKMLLRQLGIRYSDGLEMVKQARAGKAADIETGGQPVTPEQKAAIDNQMEALRRGDVKAVHLPPEAPYVPAQPEGVGRVDIRDGQHAGTVLYRKGEIRAQTIKAAAKAGTLEELLQGKESGFADLGFQPEQQPAQAPTPAQPEQPAQPQQPAQPERRQNLTERQRVSEMTPEQMRAELLTSPKTGLPNRRAFDEAEHAQPAGAVAQSDADGLKALNDKFGYAAGDALLKAKAEALQAAGLEAYHEKGDEFLYRGNTPEELQQKLEQARGILRGREFKATLPDGSVQILKGADFSYGTGSNLAEAETGLKSHKSEREARGERARGELRGITAEAPAGNEDRTAAAEVEKPTKYEYGNTQAAIPEGSDAGHALADARGKIDKADLITTGYGGNDEGLETEPHVTLRYGLKDADTAGIRKYLEAQAPFEATLGKTTSFPPSKSSDGGAPIIAPVEAPELRAMEAELDKHGNFIDRTFPEYKPHATLGYVKPEAAKKYEGMTETEGKRFRVDSIQISHKDGTKEDVPLKGKPSARTNRVRAAAAGAEGVAAPREGAGAEAETKPAERPGQPQSAVAPRKVKLGDTVTSNGRKYIVGNPDKDGNMMAVPANTPQGARLRGALNNGDAMKVRDIFSEYGQPLGANEVDEAPAATPATSERKGGRGESPEPTPGIRQGARVTFTTANGEEHTGVVKGKTPNGTLVIKTEKGGRALVAPNRVKATEEQPKPSDAPATFKRGDAVLYEGKPGTVEMSGTEMHIPYWGATPSRKDYVSIKFEDGTHEDVSPAKLTLAKPSQEAQNGPNGTAEQPAAGVAEAGGGRPAADTGSADREPVAEVPARVHQEPGESALVPEHGAGESADLRAHPASVPGEGAGSGPGEGSGAGRDNAPGFSGVDRQKELAKSEKQPPKNQEWFAHPADWFPPGGEVTRTENNLRAIQIIRDLEKEPRKLTDEEKEALANYIGWGALPTVFDPYRNYSDRSTFQRWLKLNERLRELVSDEEFDAARKSTMNAHYTSPELVRWMWNVAQRFGFKGGVVLEPAMGTGNFFGMMPKSIRNKSQAIGNELDKLTFLIAQQLYPGATLHNLDFKDLILPNDSIDLAIGNPPFGDYTLYDPRYPRLKAMIHDYFFIKSLDKVRPGGVLMYITGTGTMDRGNSEFRRLMASKAKLVAAFRLPMDAFLKNAGTSVTTDVLFLQRRLSGDTEPGEAWIDAKDLDVPLAKDPTHFEKLRLNEYWQNHSSHLLGLPRAGTKMYGSLRFELHPKPDTKIEDLLKKAYEALPKGIMLESRHPVGASTIDTPAVFAPQTLLDGQYTLEKGKVLQNKGGKLVPAAVIENKDGSINPTKFERVKAMIGLRDQLNDLLSQMKTLPDDDPSNAIIRKGQAALKKGYTAFAKKFGLLHGVANSGVFRDDPHYPRLLSLEQYDKATKTATPAPIFTTRTIVPAEPLRSVSPDPSEALHQVLAERGYADLPLIAELQGKPLEEVAKALTDKGLVFRNPINGDWEIREKYLSGYVRDKLRDAEAAVAQGHPEYQRNVEELKKVIPEDIPIWTGNENTQIAIRPGATWIPMDLFRDFGRAALGSPMNVSYNQGAWNVARMPATAEVTNTYGTPRINADDLFELALNMKRPVIRDRAADDKTVVNPQETAAAVLAQDKLVTKFAEWAAQHPQWGPRLQRIYNDNYNNLVRPQYDGAHLVLHGANREVVPRSHQVNVAWRILQDGRALVAHEVGAGKTIAMTIAAIEGRRLGLWHKPMIAVPNHLTEQWRREILWLYPTANILSPTEEDFSAKNRQRMMSRIATGDYDAILLAHSQFDLMDISPEHQRRTFEALIDELEETIRGLKGDRENKRTVKELEKAKAKLEARMAALADLKADRTINFDDLGVDMLFVDEAHEYKNLAFYTKMTRVAGLGQGDAKKAFRLKMKTDYLQRQNNGRGVVFATGTPLQNTMAEMYSMMKYVAPDVLEKAGIKYFDDWAGNFGKVVTANELSADGQTYKTRDKFIRFVNVPELMQMFHSFADVKTAAELNLPRPELEGGKPIIVSVKPSKEVLDYVATLIKRAEQLKGKPPKGKGADNMLAVVTDGRKAATDLRLVDASYPDDPDSKLNKAVADVFSEWKAGKGERTTHLIFLDMFQAFEKMRDPETGDTIIGPPRLNLYHDIRDKLIARGVPREEIAIIQDYPDRKKRQGLFEDMNAGRVRILMGSTKKMGAGMNAQARMKSLHHVDLPWKPGELEQRNGRILRQGNMHKTVRIQNYVTEKTFDAYMAQTLQGKAEFIGQVMSGQSKDRVMADLAADQVLSLEEMKIAASGNPDVKRKFDLELEISHLRMLEQAHRSQQSDNRYQAELARNEVGRLDRDLANLRQAQESIAKFAGDDGKGLSVQVDGRTFTDRKTLFEHLEAMAVPPVNFEMVWSGVPVWAEPREVEQTVRDENGKRQIKTAKELVYQARFMQYSSTAPDFTMASLGMSLESRVRQIPDRIETLQMTLDGTKERAEKLEKLAEGTPFSEAGKLAKAREELKEVEKRLGLGNVNDGHLDEGQAVAADVDAAPDPLTTSSFGDEEEDDGAPESTGVTLRSSVFGLDLLAEFAAKQGKAFWDADIAPHLATFAEHTREAAAGIVHVLYPRIGANADAQDILGKARGKLEAHLFALEHLDGGLEEYFDRMPRDAQLAFIDRYKLGVGQPSQDLQRIENIMRRIDERSLKLAQQYKPTLQAKEDHFRVIWKVLPFTGQDARGKSAQFAKSRRPFQGDKGFMKRATLETISEGINAGGVPVSTNPWKLFTLAQASIMKYISAQQAWAEAKQLGLRKFVKRGQQPPDGWVKINDRIAAVYFPTSALTVDPWTDLPQKMVGPKGHQKPWVPLEDIETRKVMDNPGEWYAEPGFGRLLNNYLSPDKIRQSAIGSGLMFAKNLSTGIELSLSPFHAIFETIEAVGSQFGLGVQRVWNNGVRLGDGAQLTQGVKEIATSVAAPFLLSRAGGSVKKYAENPQQFLQTPRGQKFLQRFPNTPQALQDLFNGGLTFGVQRDFRFDPEKSLMEAAKEGNYVGALLRVVPWVNTVLMKPLFEHYIPRLKWGLALGQYGQQLLENRDALASGETTRTEIARKVADTIENRFGEMNFNNIYWNNTIKSSFQFIFRSITWKLGNWRGAGSAAGPEAYAAFRDPLKAMREDWEAHRKGKPGTHGFAEKVLPKIGMNQAWLIGLAFTTAVLGTIIGRALTGHWPWELAESDRKEGYSLPGAIALETMHPRTGRTNKFTGKPERVSLPTGLKDFEHAYRDPGSYIHGSLSGFVGRLYDTWENRDAFKNYVYDPHGTEYQKMADIFRYNAPMPISLSNWKDQYGGKDTESKVLRAAGLGSAGSTLDLSPAEQRMRDLRFHEPETPEQIRSREQEEMHPTRQQVLRALRSRNLDYAQRMFKGLSYADARDVYDHYATPEERGHLHRLLIEKRENHLKRVGR